MFGLPLLPLGLISDVSKAVRVLEFLDTVGEMLPDKEKSRLREIAEQEDIDNDIDKFLAKRKEIRDAAKVSVNIAGLGQRQVNPTMAQALEKNDERKKAQEQRKQLSNQLQDDEISKGGVDKVSDIKEVLGKVSDVFAIRKGQVETRLKPTSFFGKLFFPLTKRKRIQTLEEELQNRYDQIIYTLYTEEDPKNIIKPIVDYCLLRSEILGADHQESKKEAARIINELCGERGKLQVDRKYHFSTVPQNMQTIWETSLRLSNIGQKSFAEARKAKDANRIIAQIKEVSIKINRYMEGEVNREIRESEKAANTQRNLGQKIKSALGLDNTPDLTNNYTREIVANAARILSAQPKGGLFLNPRKAKILEDKIERLVNSGALSIKTEDLENRQYHDIFSQELISAINRKQVIVRNQDKGEGHYSLTINKSLAEKELDLSLRISFESASRRIDEMKYKALMDIDPNNLSENLVNKFSISLEKFIENGSLRSLSKEEKQELSVKCNGIIEKINPQGENYQASLRRLEKAKESLKTTTIDARNQQNNSVANRIITNAARKISNKAGEAEHLIKPSRVTELGNYLKTSIDSITNNDNFINKDEFYEIIENKLNESRILISNPNRNKDGQVKAGFFEVTIAKDQRAALGLNIDALVTKARNSWYEQYYLELLEENNSIARLEGNEHKNDRKEQYKTRLEDALEQPLRQYLSNAENKIAKLQAINEQMRDQNQPQVDGIQRAPNNNPQGDYKIADDIIKAALIKLGAKGSSIEDNIKDERIAELRNFINTVTTQNDSITRLANFANLFADKLSADKLLFRKLGRHDKPFTIADKIRGNIDIDTEDFARDLFCDSVLSMVLQVESLNGNMAEAKLNIMRQQVKETIKYIAVNQLNRSLAKKIFTGIKNKQIIINQADKQDQVADRRGSWSRAAEGLVGVTHHDYSINPKYSGSALTDAMNAIKKTIVDRGDNQSLDSSIIEGEGVAVGNPLQAENPQEDELTIDIQKFPSRTLLGKKDILSRHMDIAVFTSDYIKLLKLANATVALNKNDEELIYYRDQIVRNLSKKEWSEGNKKQYREFIDILDDILAEKKDIVSPKKPIKLAKGEIIRPMALEEIRQIRLDVIANGAIDNTKKLIGEDSDHHKLHELYSKPNQNKATRDKIDSYFDYVAAQTGVRISGVASGDFSLQYASDKSDQAKIYHELFGCAKQIDDFIKHIDEVKSFADYMGSIATNRLKRTVELVAPQAQDQAQDQDQDQDQEEEIQIAPAPVAQKQLIVRKRELDTPQEIVRNILETKAAKLNSKKSHLIDPVKEGNLVEFVALSLELKENYAEQLKNNVRLSKKPQYILSYNDSLDKEIDKLRNKKILKIIEKAAEIKLERSVSVDNLFKTDKYNLLVQVVGKEMANSNTTIGELAVTIADKYMTPSRTGNHELAINKDEIDKTLKQHITPKGEDFNPLIIKAIRSFALENHKKLGDVEKYAKRLDDLESKPHMLKANMEAGKYDTLIALLQRKRDEIKDGVDKDNQLEAYCKSLLKPSKGNNIVSIQDPQTILKYPNALLQQSKQTSI